MAALKRIKNILRYGLGENARQRKKADKAAARKKTFESGLWDQKEELVKRNYKSYDEYLQHQAAKLDKIEHRLEETKAEDLADFKRRFQECSLLSEARNVLCLGARTGTEVEAFHSTGHFAIGIDLNPGKDNLYVLQGDFHNIVFPDGSVDAIYTNVLDHVFDLERLLAEIRRLLRPGGLFIADVLQGYEEGFVPGAYEATHWATKQILFDKILGISGFTLEEVRDLGQVRRDHWTQAVFRKPAN